MRGILGSLVSQKFTFQAFRKAVICYPHNWRLYDLISGKFRLSSVMGEECCENFRFSGIICGQNRRWVLSSLRVKKRLAYEMFVLYKIPTKAYDEKFRIYDRSSAYLR